MHLLRAIRHWAASLIVAALMIHAPVAGGMRVATPAGADPAAKVVFDAVLGPLALCSAHPAGLDDGGPGTPAPARHCPLCTLLSAAVPPAPPATLAERVAAVPRATLPPLDVSTLPRHIATGTRSSRAPPVLLA